MGSHSGPHEWLPMVRQFHAGLSSSTGSSEGHTLFVVSFTAWAAVVAGRAAGVELHPERVAARARADRAAIRAMRVVVMGPV